MHQNKLICMNAEDDIISQIKEIFSEHYSIAREGFGPWSEVSEVREQREEADSYVNSFNISKLQNKLAQTIRDAEDPMKYIEFILSKYKPAWVVQPYKFFNSIIECDAVKLSITQAVPKFASKILELEEPEKILKFLIDINPENRENPQIMDVVRKMMDKS